MNDKEFETRVIEIADQAGLIWHAGLSKVGILMVEAIDFARAIRDLVAPEVAELRKDAYADIEEADRRLATSQAQNK